MIKVDGAVKVSPYKETECQDNISYGISGEDAWGVVYDGAGSLKLSGEAGAKIVYIAGMLLQAGRSVEEVWSAIVQYLPMFKEWRLMGGTIALFKGNSDKLTVLVVGDAFGVVNSSGEWQLVTGEESVGEYANETKLITSNNVTPTIKVFSDVSAVAVSSDGLEKLTLKNKQPFTNFWNKAVNLPVRLILKFVENSKRQDDDLGFVIAKFRD